MARVPVRRGLPGALLAAGVLAGACAEARAPAVRGGVNVPVAVGGNSLEPAVIRGFLAEELGFTSQGGRVFCSYEVLGREGARVFLGTVCEELVPVGDSLVVGSGRGGPVALVVDTGAGAVRIVGVQVPGDGALYRGDVGRIFPAEVRRGMRVGAEEQARRVGAMREANRAARGGGLEERGGRLAEGG